MAGSTTNLGLIKPLGTEKIRIAQINQNSDTLDAAIGAVGSTSLQTQMNNVQDALAIIANGDTHPAITAGQFVYVKNNTHSVAEGLHVATANISANGQITTSNVSADASGGLNTLNGGLNTLNAKIVSYHVATDVSLASLQSSLETLGASMQDGDVRSIDFSVAPATGVFAQARTFGFIRRISNGRYLVSVQQGQTGGKTITGYLFNNVWSWESVSDNFEKLQYGINALDTNIGAGETITKTYSFPHQYTNNSVVIPQVVWYGVPNVLHWQLLSTTVSNFTIRIKNDYTAAIPASDVSIRWIAFGN